MERGVLAVSTDMRQSRALTGALILHFRAREGTRFLKPDENWPLSVSLTDRTTFTRPPDFRDIYLPPPPPASGPIEEAQTGMEPQPDAKG